MRKVNHRIHVHAPKTKIKSVSSAKMKSPAAKVRARSYSKQYYRSLSQTEKNWRQERQEWLSQSGYISDVMQRRQEAKQQKIDAEDRDYRGKKASRLRSAQELQKNMQAQRDLTKLIHSNHTIGGSHEAHSLMNNLSQKQRELEEHHRQNLSEEQSHRPGSLKNAVRKAKNWFKKPMADKVKLPDYMHPLPSFHTMHPAHF